jgi:hypothetical protein
MAPSGLSFYGNFQSTLLPYLIGFGCMAACMGYAAHILRATEGTFVKPIRNTLWISAICTVGIIVTPSFGWLPLRLLHFGCAAVLFVSQLSLGRDLALSRLGLRTEHFIFGLQLVGVLGIILSYRRIALLHVMIPAQVAAGIAFSALVSRTLTVLARKQPGAILHPAFIEEETLTEEPSGNS